MNSVTQPAKKFIKAGEIETAFIKVGSGEEIVIFLHGWGGQIESFAPIYMELAAGYECIVPDLPGFGQSQVPDTPWGVEDYASWLAEFLRALEIKAASFICHSFGGRLGIIQAAAFPETVRKLILTDSSGIKPKRSASYYRKVYTYKLAKYFSTSSIKPVAEFASQIKDRMISQNASKDYQEAGTLRASFVKIVNHDIRSFLPGIEAPTLLIWGGKDEDTPLSDAKTLEKNIHDAGLVIFEGCGHFAYLEQPQRFCTIVKTFLQS